MAACGCRTRTKYAEVLLGIALPKEGYTREKIKSMYGRSEIDIRFPTPIPVHITYQTAFVDEAGQLQIREDLYGRDARLLAALKEDRRQAEIPVARAQPNYGRPLGAAADGLSATTLVERAVVLRPAVW